MASPAPPLVIPEAPVSSPTGGHTTVLVLFISLGGIFFLAFLAAAICWSLKEKKKMVQKTEAINVDEHFKVQEAIVPGPHGKQSVVLSMEEDVHFQEASKMNETVGEEQLAKKPDSLQEKRGTEKVLQDKAADTVPSSSGF